MGIASVQRTCRIDPKVLVVVMLRSIAGRVRNQSVAESIEMAVEANLNSTRSSLIHLILLLD